MIFLRITFVITVTGRKDEIYIITRDSWTKHIIAMNSLQVCADVGVSLSTLQQQLFILSVKWLVYWSFLKKTFGEILFLFVWLVLFSQNNVGKIFGLCEKVSEF